MPSMFKPFRLATMQPNCVHVASQPGGITIVVSRSSMIAGPAMDLAGGQGGAVIDLDGVIRPATAERCDGTSAAPAAAGSVHWPVERRLSGPRAVSRQLTISIGTCDGLTPY